MASPMLWSQHCTVPRGSPALSAIRTWMIKMSFENTNNSPVVSCFSNEQVPLHLVKSCTSYLRCGAFKSEQRERLGSMMKASNRRAARFWAMHLDWAPQNHVSNSVGLRRVESQRQVRVAAFLTLHHAWNKPRSYELSRSQSSTHLGVRVFGFDKA